MRFVIDAYPQSGSRRPTPFSVRLREATRDHHGRAERTGFVREMLRGGASREGYALFARNLLPAYVAMERDIERLASSPVLGLLAHPPVYRAASLEADLEGLAGPSWRQSLPVLAAARRYAERIAMVAADGNGERLVAHAYVRYMGDLNGGQVLARLLAKNLGLDTAMLSFYAFPAIGDLGAFKASYRDWIDAAGEEIEDVDAVIDEAAEAFELNIAVSNAVLGRISRRDRASAR